MAEHHHRIRVYLASAILLLAVINTVHLLNLSIIIIIIINHRPVFLTKIQTFVDALSVWEY